MNSKSPTTILTAVLAFGLPLAFPHCGEAQFPFPFSFTSAVPLSAHEMDVLGVDAAKLKANEPLRTALEKGLAAFKSGDAARMLDRFDAAHAADASLDVGVGLAARLLADDAIAKSIPDWKSSANEQAIFNQQLEFRSNEAYAKSTKAGDAKERRAEQAEALRYAKALMNLKPHEPEYRFNTAYIYQEMGEIERAKKSWTSWLRATRAASPKPTSGRRINYFPRTVR